MRDSTLRTSEKSLISAWVASLETTFKYETQISLSRTTTIRLWTTTLRLTSQWSTRVSRVAQSLRGRYKLRLAKTYTVRYSSLVEADSRVQGSGQPSISRSLLLRKRRPYQSLAPLIGRKRVDPRMFAIRGRRPNNLSQKRWSSQVLY